MKYENPKVVILILNWNNWEDTIECLESLSKIEYDNYHTIIIDNGSNNASVEKIKDYCEISVGIIPDFVEYISENKYLNISEDKNINLEGILVNKGRLGTSDLEPKITLIRNEINYGFTKGSNIGINYALKFLNPQYTLLLNNDTIVDKNFLKELIKCGENCIDVGFISPKIYFNDYRGKKNVIQYAGAEQSLWFANIKIEGIFEEDSGRYNIIKETDCPHGSCLLAKVKMIKEVGMLDEDYFSYREENDWAIRGHKNGWKSLYVPNSIIWHKGGKSAGGNLSPLTVFYMTRNDFILVKKHGNVFQKLTFYIYFLFFKFWFMTGVYLLYHKNYNAFITFFRGFKEGLLW